MNNLNSEQENIIKSTIKVEHQILKAYSKSYYWGNDIKSVITKVVPGVMKFLLSKQISSSDTKLNINSCIKVFWRVKGKLSGHNSQEIDLLVFGKYTDFEYRNMNIVLESIELFINQEGNMISDIKLTFLEQQINDQESQKILEIEPMYITPKQLTKMTKLYDFIDDLIETALKEHKQ